MTVEQGLRITQSGGAIMEIEQYPPKKPNFLLVVLLAVAVLFLLFILAYFFVDVEGHHIHIGRKHANPNARLVMPFTASAA
jgi:flagellar basal body-associated protein FliL